jgi:hypothetical protein
VSGFSFAYNLHTDFCFLVNNPDSEDLQSGPLGLVTNREAQADLYKIYSKHDYNHKS